VISFKHQLVVAGLLLAVTASVAAQSKSSNSVTIIYRDHHQQTVSSADISRIDFRNDVLVLNRNGHEEKIPLNNVSNLEVHEAPADGMSARSHYVGKWRVGMDTGTSRSFEITLDRNGQARKTLGGPHGTWTFVDGGAQIAWEDGWHDMIIKVGDKYEKRAFEPGKPFSAAPSNVTEAKRANDQSI
jgi:hypothetical protein